MPSIGKGLASQVLGAYNLAMPSMGNLTTC